MVKLYKGLLILLLVSMVVFAGCDFFSLGAQERKPLTFDPASHSDVPIYDASAGAAAWDSDVFFGGIVRVPGATVDQLLITFKGPYDLSKLVAIEVTVDDDTTPPFATAAQAVVYFVDEDGTVGSANTMSGEGTTDLEIEFDVGDVGVVSAVIFGSPTVASTSAGLGTGNDQIAEIVFWFED